MDDYEGFHDMDTPEQSGAEGETPINMNAAAPTDTAADASLSGSGRRWHGGRYV